MKIAVIGSGAAGLSAARALARHHEVEVFERELDPGGHVSTVVDREGVALDTGFLVYNERRYPHFARLLHELEVPTRDTSMSFSVSAEDGAAEWGSADLSAAFARRRDLLRPGHYRLLGGVLAFLGRARRDLEVGAATGLRLDEYAERRRLPSGVREHFLVPLAGALWSLGRRAAGRLPAEVFLRFLHAHGMLTPLRPPRWRSIPGGSRRYVDALLARARFALRLGAPVARVERDPAGVTVALDGGDARRFDRVVLAVHADQALALLAEPTSSERRVLGGFSFAENRVVLHTDASHLPAAPAARASWNYRVEQKEEGAVSVTYWLNRLQGIAGPRDYLVTLNPRRPIAPAQVIRDATMRHPAFDLDALAAQQEIPRLQGTRHTYYAGAWTGFGFHEDGMRAGLTAAARVR